MYQLFIILLSIGFVISVNVTFYEHSNYLGASITEKIPDESLPLTMRCVNLPREWWDRASSINTRRGCITAYSREFCHSLGTPVWLYGDGTASERVIHSNFGNTWLNDNIRSFSDCKFYYSNE